MAGKYIRNLVNRGRVAGKTAGGTVNDAFVAGVAGGLRRYHECLGAPADELRMLMPVNMRDGADARNAGNQFAPARFPVPVGIADPIEILSWLFLGSAPLPDPFPDCGPDSTPDPLTCIFDNPGCP